ncbi:MAG TPA: sigma-70 family RNA polymerase sigma factor, partial [Planctomycetota bacterium]|nr:sigma-70 family RNA polymerase sigma factor [Planctomycetota bacterium]
MDPATADFVSFREHGDLGALGRVFDALGPRLLALALHVCGNGADAEDALQATFVVAMQKSTAFDARQPVGPWLAGILSGEAGNLRRREHRRAAVPVPDQVSGGDDPAAAAERRDLVARLRTNIESLPAEQRQVLLLQLQHGLQPAEIAEVLGVPPGTVRMRLHRGLAALRGLMPAGLLAGLIAGLPSRGLAAVRRAVLASARSQAAAAGAATAIVGSLLMKKVVTVILFVLGVCCCSWWREACSAAPAAEVSRPMPAPLAAGAAADRVAGTTRSDRKEPAMERTAVAPPASATGTLRVVVRGAVFARGEHGWWVADSGSARSMADVAIEAWPGEAHALADEGTGLSGRTDAAGVVRFAPVPVGTWYAHALLGGQRLGNPQSAEVTSGGDATIEIVSGISGCVHGRVLDDDGAPVEGAEIWVGALIHGTAPVGRWLRCAAHSDADGRFSCPYGAGEDRVTAQKAGHAASWSHPCQRSGDEPEVVLTLGREPASIGGFVVDARGQPLAGIDVAVEMADREERRLLDGTRVASRLATIATSDRDGRFLAAGLAPGSYVCRAQAPPRLRAVAQADVGAGAHAEVRLELGDGCVVCGRVRARDGTGSGGIRVTIAGAAIAEAQTTAADGSFRFGSVPARPFTITAARPGSTASTTQAHAAPTTDVVRCELTLDEGAPLRGKVTDVEGHGLPGWSVTAFVDARASVETPTDGEGAFVFWALPAASVRLCVHRAHGTAVCEQTILPSNEPVHLVVPAAAMPSAAVHLRVVDERGVPVARAHGALDQGVPSGLFGDNESGEFEWTGLDAGAHEIVCGATGRLSERLEVTLAPRQSLGLGDVVLRPAAELRVRFLRPDGSPWQVRPPTPCLLPAGTNRPARCDLEIVDGEVIASGLAPGRYTVAGWPADELLVEPREVELGATEPLRITMPVEVGRRRHLCLPADVVPLGTVVEVTVRRRTDGHLVAAKQLFPRESDRVTIGRFLVPLGDFEAEARAPSGAVLRARFTVGPELE